MTQSGKDEYQQCTRCIMDTSDPQIVFHSDGICSHCQNFDAHIKPHWFPNEAGQQRLNRMIDEIKRDGDKKPYDAIIGLSGGVDSSYLAYWAKQIAGLRLLAVHVDGGWNSELAVKNIEQVVKKLGIDLYTHVVNWEEMCDLQFAFLKSGVANQDTPQDHAFFAALYTYAIKNNIRYVLNGSNFATESILPRAWGHNPMDITQLKAIHRRFGTVPLKTFPLVSFFKYYFEYPILRQMRVIRPLNDMPYHKEAAMHLLQEKLGWQYYGGKHYESRFTKFFQAHWLPMKFGYDKRLAHLSSLILSEQMTREEALHEMQKPLYDPIQLAEDKIFIAKKLRTTVDILDDLIKAPNKNYADYPNHQWKVDICRRLQKMLRGIKS